MKNKVLLEAALERIENPIDTYAIYAEYLANDKQGSLSLKQAIGRIAERLKATGDLGMMNDAVLELMLIQSSMVRELTGNK